MAGNEESQQWDSQRQCTSKQNNENILEQPQKKKAHARSKVHYELFMNSVPGDQKKKNRLRVFQLQLPLKTKYCQDET
jgi:hypothetical protein